MFVKLIQTEVARRRRSGRLKELLVDFEGFTDVARRRSNSEVSRSVRLQPPLMV